MSAFLTSGTLFNKVNMRSAADKPFWKLGEYENALPIDQEPTITISDTLN